MENKEDIQKFINAHRDAAELKSQAYEIKESVEEFEKSVVLRVVEIKGLRARAYKTKARGRVDNIVYINNSTVCFDVSYCGCCMNDEEELNADLLLMDNEDITKFFEAEKWASDEAKAKEEKQEKAVKKAELKAHEKAEYERLKSKFGKGDENNGNV